MSRPIRVYYHDGFYYRRDPIRTLGNLLRYGKLHHPVYNIGDQISPVIVSHFAGRPAKYAPPFTRNKLIAVGSVLAGVKPGDTIWGSGLMKADHIQYVKLVKNFTIRAVRGPRTRETLLAAGYQCPEVFGDPGLLMPLVFPREHTKEFKYGIIPHHSQIAEFQATPYGDDTLLIPPKQEWQEFITNLCRCETIVSSSLHGVILADAYGIPALPMVHGSWLHGTPFKFEDYFLSTGRSANFISSEDAHSRSLIADKLEELGAPRIDLRPLLRAFPYLADSAQIERATYLLPS